MKRNLSIFILLALLVTLLVLPVQAEAQLAYVTDAAGLLSDTQRQTLETLSSSLSEQYDCGVYIVTVDDFTEYGSGDVYEVYLRQP